MNAFARLLFCLSATLLALAACQPVEPTRPKPLTFSQYAPITLDVSSIDVVQEYKPPLAAPNVEHFFPTPPAQAMAAWVKDRLRATGGSRSLQVIVKDASVVAEPLPRTQGLEGAYTIDQAQRYSARLEVEMRIYGPNRAISEASISTVATRADTAAENFSPADRDALFDRMTRDLMSIMNAELEKNMQQYFSPYIHYSPDM